MEERKLPKKQQNRICQLIQRANSLEKTLMLGKTEGRRKTGQQRINSIDVSLSKLREMVKDREAYCAAVHGVVKCQTLMSNCITTAISYSKTKETGN